MLQREMFWDCEEEAIDKVFRILRSVTEKNETNTVKFEKQIDYVLAQMKLVGLEPNKM